MNIKDIINDDIIEDLDGFLIKNMLQVAGENLTKKIKNLFEDEESAKNWFYSPLIALDGKRPYDFCKDGRSSEVEDILGRMDFGVY